MTQLILTRQKNELKNQNTGIFHIEPLDSGQGITLGNLLRRTLLADVSGLGITSLSINNILNEFDSITHIREDVLELILNLKEIVFSSSTISSKKKYLTLFDETNIKQTSEVIKGIILIKGPKIITSDLFKLPKSVIRIINPNSYICTIVNYSTLFLEVNIKKGKGFSYANFSENYISKNNKKFFPIDTNFSPVKKVYYNVRLIYNDIGLLKEALTINVTTNGGITPTRAVCDSLKILTTILYPLFISIKSFSKKYKFYERNKKFYDKCKFTKIRYN